MCIFQREKVAEVRDQRSPRRMPLCGIFGSGETPVQRILTHSSLGGRGGSANLTALGQMVRENGSLSSAGDPVSRPRAVGPSARLTAALRVPSRPQRAAGRAGPGGSAVPSAAVSFCPRSGPGPPRQSLARRWDSAGGAQGGARGVSSLFWHFQGLGLKHLWGRARGRPVRWRDLTMGAWL